MCVYGAKLWFLAAINYNVLETLNFDIMFLQRGIVTNDVVLNLSAMFKIRSIGGAGKTPRILDTGSAKRQVVSFAT
jgi:hypothetical protein